MYVYRLYIEKLLSVLYIKKNIYSFAIKIHMCNICDKSLPLSFSQKGSRELCD